MSRLSSRMVKGPLGTKDKLRKPVVRPRTLPLITPQCVTCKQKLAEQLRGLKRNGAFQDLLVEIHVKSENVVELKIQVPEYSAALNALPEEVYEPTADFFKKIISTYGASIVGTISNRQNRMGMIIRPAKAT